MTLLSPQSMIKNIHVKPYFLNQKHSMFVETFTLNFKREATVNYCTQSSWDNNYFWGLLKICFQWNPFSFVSDYNFISIVGITSSMIFDIRSRCAHVDVDKNIIYNKFSWMKYFLPQKIFFFYFFLENHEDLPTAATTFTQTNIRLWNEVNNEIKTI